jgi:hypothetical protein
LSIIARDGCSHAGNEFANRGQPVKIFEKWLGKLEEFEAKSEWTTRLYIPSKPNYKGVDAVCLAWTPDKKRAIVVGIQITINDKHSDSDSESKFFSQASVWDTHLSCDETEFRFLWISENAHKHKVGPVEGKTLGLRQKINVVKPNFQRLSVTFVEVNPAISRKLQLAREKVKAYQN